MAEWYKRHQNVRILMNGKVDLAWIDYENMQDTIEEALEQML